MKKVCVITTTRAEYGLLFPLLKHLEKNDKLELQIIATGTHLEKAYGNTVREIINDGFSVNAGIPIIKNDSKTGILQTMANATNKVGSTIAKLNPDMVVLLGDRYEAFSIASSCVILGIPIAHISGGELTYGAYDELFRHAITKISYLHFTSTEEYRDRVIQMGESPNRVFNVGALGVENVLNYKFLSRENLEKKLGFAIEKTLLATFHPLTMETASQKEQFNELLSAIEQQTTYNVLFTKPNADTDRAELVVMLEEFANKYPQKIRVVDSLGAIKYLSVMKYCSGVIGNSSSGILEAPSMKKGTINIGNRQKGRLAADSVIHCEAKKEKILKALEVLSSNEFQETLINVKNIYEKENTSKTIVKEIEKALYGGIKVKKFYDLPVKIKNGKIKK